MSMLTIMTVMIVVKAQMMVMIVIMTAIAITMASILSDVQCTRSLISVDGIGTTKHLEIQIF